MSHTVVKTASNKANSQDCTATAAVMNEIDKEFQANSEDDAFWWSASGQPLCTLLQQNQYSHDRQLYLLRWFRQRVLPSLGPRPSGTKPYYGSWLTYDGSPLEYSLNWKEKKPNQTIRFTIEPTSSKAGTAADRLNQLGAKELLTTLSKEIPSIDLKRFNLFLEDTYVPDDAIEEVISKHPAGFPQSRVWVAFDLERSGDIVAKAYFLPHWREIYTGTPTKTIVFDAIKKCNGPLGSYDASIAALDGYLESFPSEEAPKIVLLSNDCVADSPAARMKVYLHTSVDTLAKAKDMFHLGGRLSGTAITAGLQALDEFWHHLFGFSKSDPDAQHKMVMPGHKCLFVFEMRPTQEGEQDATPDIEVKVHLPMWDIGKTDAEISELLASWFQAHGHRDLAERYQADLDAAFPKHNIKTSSGTHTFLSLTYTHKTGLYMTMYYTTKFPELYYLPN
nr:prenyltransferase PT1 [Periconia sp.]